MRDVLRWPLIGPLLRWRWGRLALQSLLLIVAALILYDGMTGPPQAYRNLATVLPWVHYRGLIVLALLVAGNLFCMACPFALPRTLAHRLSRRGRRWPRALRNKWLGLGLLLALFWAYEAFDLWASPWWTAWLTVAYFVAAFTLELLFADSPFCKYLCPLGNFNFVHAAVAPLQITARDPGRCRTCEGHECVNGAPQVAGCGTALYVPQIRSNMDCVLCLDCVRACPYDNVALAVRPALAEVRDPTTWPSRLDWSVLVWVLLFLGLGNAMGMVRTGYRALDRLAGWGVTDPRWALLLLQLGVNLALPLALGWGAAWLSRRMLPSSPSLRRVFTRLTPALIPLSFGIWTAHYGFHFATSALAVIPVVQTFLADHGWLIGQANWALRGLLPAGWLLPLQALAVALGLAGTLWALRERAGRAWPQTDPRRVTWPWVLVAAVVALAALYLFAQPMEMRGTIEAGVGSAPICSP